MGKAWLRLGKMRYHAVKILARDIVLHQRPVKILHRHAMRIPAIADPCLDCTCSACLKAA